MIKPQTVQQKSKQIVKDIELKEKQTDTFNNFLKEIKILKNKTPTSKNIQNFAEDLKKIGYKLEKAELNDEQFDFLEEQLLELLDHLEKESLKGEIDKKVKKKPVKVKKESIPKPITKQPKKITPPVLKRQPIKKSATQFITKEIEKPGMGILDFKKKLDKRINDLQELKFEESQSEIFEYFIDEINDIIESTTYSFEDIDLKENYQNLKILEKSLYLQKDKLSKDEYSILKKEILKLGKYLQDLLREKGVKFKKDKAVLKEETLKGKAKKFFKEKKFESAGGLLFAITNSPLLMILGKQLDDFLQRRREEKNEEEQKQLDKISEIYKKRLSGKKKEEVKQKKEVKHPEKEDIIEDTLFPQSFPTEPSKELEMGNDLEYQKMLSNLKMFADESADELDLSQEHKEKISKELSNIPEHRKDEEDYEEIPEKEPIKKKNKELKPYNFDEEDEKLYELMKTHIPSIDENIEKLINKYKEANEEQKVTERDNALKAIAESLEKKKEIKTDEKGETRKGLKSLIPHIGMIGKILAGVGAFGIGWMIGKKLDKWLGISKGIQSIVDKLQGTVDDYYKKSLKKHMTEKQIEKIKSVDVLKEKLGLKRFTNRETYELLKRDKTILKKLDETEKRIVLGKAGAYEKILERKRKRQEIPTVKSKMEKQQPIKKETVIEKMPITKEQPEKQTELETQKKQVDMTSFFSNVPILSNYYEKYKTENIKKFESEKGDDITNTSVVKKTEKPMTENIDMSSVTATNKNVDIQNLNPVVKNNLLSMATEYKEDKGKPLPINSAYRSTAKQEELYRKYPGKAARPGTSMHEKGLAVDINTRNVNELRSTGLLQKYGFHTPVKRETWHVEPTSIRTEYMKDIPSTIDNQQIGDAIPEKERKIQQKQENITSNSVFAQNNYIVTPSDFRTFIDDPELFQLFKNNYS